MPNFDSWGTSRRDPKYAPKTRQESTNKVPGRAVGVIAVGSVDLPPGAFNPYTIFFTVDKYRKDLNTVIEQQNKKPQLSTYSQSLFDSCFKNW